MKSIIIVVITILYFPVFGQLDSISSTKKHKVEVGITSASFFDSRRVILPTFGTNAFGNLFQINLKYSRAIGTISPFIQIEGFYKLYNAPLDNSTKKGDIIYRYFFIGKVGVQSSNIISLQNSHNINVGASVNYRYGQEEIFLDYFPNGFDYVTDGTQYSSIGFGSHLDYSYLIFDRLTFGLRTGFDYYLQKPGLQNEPVDSDFYKSYKPNRAILSFQPKIGFRF